MTSVLRVHGERLDVDRLSRRLPAGRIDRLWRVGDRGAAGRIASTSGITLLLTEAEDEARESEVMSALDELLPALDEALREGATAEVDIAMYVSAMGSRSVRMEPGLLGALARHGVRLRVTAYPTEENDD